MHCFASKGRRAIELDEGKTTWWPTKPGISGSKLNCTLTTEALLHHLVPIFDSSQESVQERRTKTENLNCMKFNFYYRQVILMGTSF